MSDDTTPSQSWLINGSVTLPDGENATYNMSLSPLFFNREGRSGASSEEITIAYRGEGGRSSSSTTKTPNSVYFLVFGHSDLYPSGNNSRTYALPLRCLVSTNNRIIINLVSDGGGNGVTLPDGNGAAYNANLSPIFLIREGVIGTDADSQNVASRGSQGRFWAQTSRNTETTFGLYFTSSSFSVNATNNQRPSARSLRCLVSTNNRL